MAFGLILKGNTALSTPNHSETRKALREAFDGWVWFSGRSALVRNWALHPGYIVGGNKMAKN